MRVLHIGLMVNGRKEGLSAAFIKRFGEDYRELQISERLPAEIAALDFKPDLVFMQIQNENIGNYRTVDLLKETIKKLKSEGAFVINWTGDMRGVLPTWMQYFADAVSLTCFSNQRDVENFRGEAAFLQIGFDPEVFKRWEGENEANQHDVVFMGNDYGNQFPLGGFRKNAMQQLSKFNLGIYGNYRGAVRSLNADGNNPFPMQSLESKTYNKCKIAISISHYNASRYTSDRLLRCLGSGAFVLALHYDKIDLDFNLGQHLVAFKTSNEMLDLVGHYLKEDKDREAIAQAGYKWAHKNFTYDNMVENIIKLRA